MRKILPWALLFVAAAALLAVGMTALLSVITSYSIHYTKLYDFASTTTVSGRAATEATDRA